MDARLGDDFQRLLKSAANLVDDARFLFLAPNTHEKSGARLNGGIG